MTAAQYQEMNEQAGASQDETTEHHSGEDVGLPTSGGPDG